MAGACVYSGDVLTALSLKNNNTFWVAVGHTSAWTDESSPPAEDLTITDIDDIQGFKKCDTVSLCVPDAAGTIEFRGQNYKLVADSDAYTEVARYIYFRADLKYDQFPVVTYRQTGLYANTTPATGYESNDILTPAEVASNGTLRYYHNHSPVYRTADSVDIIEIIIEIQGQTS